MGSPSGNAPLYSLNGIQKDLGGLRGTGVDIDTIATPHDAQGGGQGLSLRTKRKGFLCVPEGTQRLRSDAYKLGMFLLDDSIDLR